METSWKDQFPKENRYFETDNGILYLGDNINIMESLPEVDMVLTSPPYDNLRTYEGYSFDFEKTAQRIKKVMKQGAVLVWVVKDQTINGTESLTSFKQALYFREQTGLLLHDTMIYDKDGPPKNANRYQDDFEYMFVFVKGKLKTFNPIMVKKLNDTHKRTKKAYHRDLAHECKTFRTGKPNMRPFKKKSNIWKYNIGGDCSTTDKIAFQHPAIFPEQLAHNHIISWTNENEIILDPFFGSGTVGVMAEALDRKWIGIEISEKYCQIAKKRIQKAIQRTAMAKGTKQDTLF